MHSFLFAAIIITGALGFTRQPPSKVASWVIALLTLLGIATSPDVTTRLMFVGAAILGPLLAYPAQLVVSLTIRPDGSWVANDSNGESTIWKISIDGGRPTQLLNRYSSDPIIARHGNLVDPIIAAVEAECTIGEICGVMRDVFGEYRPSVGL